MVKVYIDSTLKHAWNIKFNSSLCAELEKLGLECYLPQRNTDQTKKPEAKFQQNSSALKKCDVLLAIALNESPNWGVEIGFANGQNKNIVILAEDSHEIPLMAEFFADEIFRVNSLGDLPSYIEQLARLLKQF